MGWGSTQAEPIVPPAPSLLPTLRGPGGRANLGQQTAGPWESGEVLRFPHRLLRRRHEQPQRSHLTCSGPLRGVNARDRCLPWTTAVALPTGRHRFRCKVCFIYTDTPLPPPPCSLEFWPGASGVLPGAPGSHMLPAMSQHLSGREEEVLPTHGAVVGSLQRRGFLRWCRSSLLRPCGGKGWLWLPPSPGAWCQHLWHPGTVCGRCDSISLRQRWLCDKETTTATQEKSRRQVKGRPSRSPVP